MPTTHIQKTKISPEILLDPEKGIATMNGESYPEDVITFYKPVFQWLEQMMSSKKPIEFIFKLDYFNTSSSKVIMDILSKLDDYHSNKGSASVKWYYKNGDDDILENGEDFSEGLSVPFEIISY